MKRKTLCNLAEWMDCKIYGNAGVSEFKDVWMDSRKLREGDVFIALKGENQDGHDYVNSAFENGAVGAVVEKEWFEKNGEHYKNFNLLAVENVLSSVQKAAKEYRGILGLPIIAITGSNGKTSTANMIKEILSKGFKIGGTKGNFNNHIGVPLSVLSLNGDEEIAVFEIGANHAGEIAELTRIIEPDMGIITNIGYAHVGLFGSIEKTAEAKFELARAISINKGVLLLNGDDEMSVKQNEIDRIPAFYFGLNKGNQIYAENAFCDENGCYSFEYDKNKYELTMPGIHAVYNVLPAVYLSLSMGVDIETVKKTVKELKPAALRGEIEIIDGKKIIADCYNANPSSMQTSLKMFSDIPCGAKKIAVLGTMGELGDYEEKLHAELGNSLKNYKIDKLIAVGKCAKIIADAALSAGFEKDGVFLADNAETAGEIVKKISEKGDTVLFKGSRSVGLEKAIKILTHSFTTISR